MLKTEKRGENIKRFILLFFFLFLIVGVLVGPTRAEAAELDSKAGAVTTTASRLNVRSSPSTAAATVATLKKGSYITLISKSGDWWRVEYGKGQYGYCHASYITIVQGTPSTVQTRSGSLNVRSGPGTSYAKQGSVSKGQTVIVLTTSGGWSRILYNGIRTGYVSAQYLSSAYGGVSVYAPNFKQTDSRWAGTLIGTSGKTMAQIGCATTAIAMMESARTGKTVYPDAMASQLRYTPSGSVYWPEHYTVITNSSGYLSAVYNLLKQGKPVLFGAQNQYGKQHWVVITGYTGGNSLVASGFTIHDPGTVTRTNLQQFLNEFPVFYKYFHY